MNKQMRQAYRQGQIDLIKMTLGTIGLIGMSMLIIAKMLMMF